MSATPYWRLIKAAQEDLRANIRQLAGDTGWTFATMCREAGVSYSKVTQGLSANRWFTSDEVDAICAVFEVSRDELMGDSVFKHEARGSEFDLPMPAEAKVGVSFGRGRALCCTCGSLRRFRRDEVGQGRQVLDTGNDPAGHRMVLQLDCGICGRVTTHAELRSDEHRDLAEERQAEPSREQRAFQRRDALIARLAGFNVDVHFRARRSQKLRADGYMCCYSFDDSKGRWRIEIDPNAASRLQSVALLQAWTAISTDEHGVDWDPKIGVVLGASDATWEAVVNDMVADIERALPVEQQRLRLHVVDEVMSAGETEASR